MNMKTSAERTFEALTWAAVVIWLGFVLVIGAQGESWLIMMMLGIIFLSSAIYQRSRNWDTSLSIWIFGIWMAVFSVIEIVNKIVASVNDSEGLNITVGVYLGIALVSMGVATILRMIQGPKIGRDVPSTVNVDYDRYGRESYGPREYEAGRTYHEGQGYSTRQGRTDRGTQYGRDPRDQGYDPRDQGYDTRRGEQGIPRDRGTQYGRDQRDPRNQGNTQRSGQGYGGDPYNDRTQYAREDDYGYQSQPVDDRGYDARQGARQQGYQDQGDYAYDEGYQDDYYDEYDYYDEPEWDAAPQVQQQQPREQRQRRRRPVANDAPSDLESRVEEIIRRSRERRSGAAGQSSDAPPPDDLPY